MLATQGSTRIYTGNQNLQSSKPLPPPTTQKELESRVEQASQLRASASQHRQNAQQAQEKKQGSLDLKARLEAARSKMNSAK